MLFVCVPIIVSQPLVVLLPGYVVLGILAVIGQSPEEKHLVADKGEAVAKPRTGRVAALGRLRLQPLPLPSTRLLSSCDL